MEPDHSSPRPRTSQPSDHGYRMTTATERSAGLQGLPLAPLVNRNRTQQPTAGRRRIRSTLRHRRAETLSP